MLLTNSNPILIPTVTTDKQQIASQAKTSDPTKPYLTVYMRLWASAPLSNLQHTYLIFRCSSVAWSSLTEPFISLWITRIAVDWFEFIFLCPHSRQRITKLASPGVVEVCLYPFPRLRHWGHGSLGVCTHSSMVWRWYWFDLSHHCELRYGHSLIKGGLAHLLGHVCVV